MILIQAFFFAFFIAPSFIYDWNHVLPQVVPDVAMLQKTAGNGMLIFKKDTFTLISQNQDFTLILYIFLSKGFCRPLQNSIGIKHFSHMFTSCCSPTPITVLVAFQFKVLGNPKVQGSVLEKVISWRPLNPWMLQGNEKTAQNQSKCTVTKYISKMLVKKTKKNTEVDVYFHGTVIDLLPSMQ